MYKPPNEIEWALNGNHEYGRRPEMSSIWRSTAFGNGYTDGTEIKMVSNVEIEYRISNARAQGRFSLFHSQTTQQVFTTPERTDSIYVGVDGSFATSNIKQASNGVYSCNLGNTNEYCFQGDFLGEQSEHVAGWAQNALGTVAFSATN